MWFYSKTLKIIINKQINTDGECQTLQVKLCDLVAPQVFLGYILEIQNIFASSIKRV